MLDIIQAGMLASVQDLGRHGQRSLGIHPGGALNTLALSTANLLVGNPVDAAGIEITMGRCEIRFGRDTRIAIGGDDIGATLNGKPMMANWSVPVPAGSIFRISPPPSAGSAAAPHAMRSYLAVAGGIDVPLILGSRSTDLKAGFGGHQGRALRNGDRLMCGPATAGQILPDGPAFGVRSPHWSGLSHRSSGNQQQIWLRVLPDAGLEQFSHAAKAVLWGQPWRITPNSNRMGCRLAGAELQRRHQHEMLSHGVVPGVIQVPPSGQPIILLGDAQTTGGYARVGTVISADLWKLAQAPLNSMLHFEPCSMQDAQAAAELQQQYLDSVRDTVSRLAWSRAMNDQK